MDEKLKRLATKIVGLFDGDFNSPQDCFEKFAVIYKSQYTYFQNFEPSNLLKLIFYIYSFKNTDDFKLAENLLNKSSFASLFRVDSDYYEETCSDCGGEGTIRCYNCHGEGTTQCSTCDGNGTVSCDTCDGSGEDEEGNRCDECQGGGGFTCDECGGEGNVECSYCEGNGSENCSTCDGSGEVETDEHPYYFYFIITWNSFIKSRCELEAGTMTPTISEYDFDRLSNDFIILGYDEDHAEFRRAVKSNEYYCINYSDEPELYRNHSSTLVFWSDDNEMQSYRV
jgi:hypothetical protein